MSNTGKIVVKKRIAKIEKTDSIQMYDKESSRLVNGKMMQRKKKGRLYSLGGNEPPKRAPRGRLDRLKTVGTFDLGNDMVLHEVVGNLNEQETSSGTIDECGATPERVQARRMSANALLASTSGSEAIGGDHRLSYTPGPHRRDVQKSAMAKRMASRDSKHPPSSASTSPNTRRLHSIVSPSKCSQQPNVPTQHSADDCLEKPKPIVEHRKSRSASTSTILNRMDGDPKHFQAGAVYKKSPNKHLPATNFIKKSDYKSRVSTQHKNVDDSLDKVVATSPPEAETTTTAIQKDETTTAQVHTQQQQQSEIEGEGEATNVVATDAGEVEEDGDASTKQSSKQTSVDSASLQDEIVSDECTYKPRKPVLRKSKRIVRTDSEELFDEAHIDSNQDGATQQTTRVQIHNEPSSNVDDGQKPESRSDDAQRDKEGSDLDDQEASAHDALKSTTTNSSRNMSVEEADTVFTDSAADLEKMERDYRELAKSNLQKREYKSDGDTLDEVGKKRNDFGNWKNQSYETDFEVYGGQSGGSGISQSVDYMEDADKIEILERRESFGAVMNSSSEDLPMKFNTESDGELQCVPSATLSGVCSPASHITCSTTNSSDTSCTKRIKEVANFFAPMSVNLSKDNLSQRESDGSAMTSPLRLAANSVQSSSPDPKRNYTASLNVAAAAQPLCARPTKLDIVQTEQTTSQPTTSTTAKEGTLMSLFEKRFGKFKKINKLLKTKRFSASALYEKSKEPIKAKSVDIATPSASASNVPLQSITSTAPAEQTHEKSDWNTKLISRSRFSPGKLSNSDSKSSSVYSSKLSLFSQIASKSSIFHKKSPMFSHSSRSNNELNTRTNSKTRLNEMSKSNSEINKYKTSPMRFSMKRSMKEKKPNSSSCVYTEPCHSPLSEEFYNKTGSVRLSAIELYHKFMLEDFVGLYKQEPFDELNGTYDSHNDFRKRYARKSARLLKQKSEPKFTFRGDPADYDPKEEDEDFYEEEFSDYYDEYEGEECEFEDEYDMEMEDEMDMEEEKEERAYQSESDVDEIFLMPEGSKCSDYEYEQYGFENKQFSLEHSMVSRLPHSADHDLSVIDEIEIPYLDDGPQPQFAYVTEQTPECDEVLTIYKICSSDDLLTVKEEPIEEEAEEAHQTQSQSASTSENTEAIICSSVECAVHAYIKNAPSDISVNIESSSEMKTDICTVIQRADSMELLSGSRSSSTVTGYDFDTVKNLNLDSCSTSKLSLSLKSDGFDDFTLTPDEPKKVVRNCDAEDFTLTPEASCNDVAPLCLSTFDDVHESDVPFIETWQSDRLCGTQREPSEQLLASEASVKPDDDSISSNEVVMVVDKFLSNERLLQQSLNIIPVDVKTFTSPLISPIDSDASSTNALIEKQKSILFNLQSSSSKSTLDDALDLDKLNFDEDYDVDGTNEKQSALTNEMTKEFDLLFSRAAVSAIASSQHPKSPNTFDLPRNQSEMATSDIDKNRSTPSSVHRAVDPNRDSHHQQYSTFESDTSSLQRLIASPTPTRIPTRYSMQKLEPYFFSDDVTQSSNGSEHAKDNKNDTDSSAAAAAAASEATATTPSDSKKDYCKVLDAHNGSFIQKKILSKLKKNKSQSLGNLNKKSRCFPL